MAQPGNGAYDTEAAEIDRRRQYAEMLRQQGMSPIPQQMAGRVVVRNSPLEGLAKALQGYVGQEGVNKAAEARKDLSGRIETDRSTDMTAMVNALRGTPARPQQMGADDMAMIADQGGEANPMIPAVPGDPNAAAMAALQSKFGDIRGMAPGLMNIAETRQNRGEDRAFREQQANQQRDFQMQQLQMRSQDARASQQERLAAQQELQQMQIQARQEMAAQSNALRRDVAAQASADRAAALAQGGKPPPGFRFKPNGDMERIPGGPADIKEEENLRKMSAGAGDVDVALGTLRDAYTRLEEGGGITSTKNSALGNIGPAIASTGVGQAAGKMFGTNNQSARNDIAMARPALLAALMKATGMSAKQMDSNAELKLWLSTATDPSLDVESNRRALNNIEKKYIAPVQKRRAGDKPAGASGEWKDL